MERTGAEILHGNLAPDGAVVKQSGVSEAMMQFTGKAICFDSEDEAMAAIMDGTVQWMMAADIPARGTGASAPKDSLEWRHACRAVAAAVFSLAKESKYNDEPWAFEFLEQRVREELLLCPDRSF